MRESRLRLYTKADELADAVIERIGPDIRLALPLGLGKANDVVNALYERAKENRSLSLKIFTALTLEIPDPENELSRRFLDPLKDRFFAGYPPLQYTAAMRNDSLPDNIAIHEFFFTPGRWLSVPAAQENYQSVNYTHVLNSLLHHKINAFATLLAPDQEVNTNTVSLSCNPDISVDLLKAREKGEINFLAIGQLNRNLPFMKGAAIRKRNDFDYLLEGEEYHFPLYKLPQEPVSLADHAIGLHVARLIPDSGTLQIGIGSIGDAICHALLLRQDKNDLFNQLLDRLATGTDQVAPYCYRDPFTKGLYAASEMLVDGFLPLLESGVLKREIEGIVLHGGFFLGSPRFYRSLAEMPGQLRDKVAMMPISFINQLYGDEKAKRRARIRARFINSALMTTLLGGVISDGLENGQVVSGVGGQYNFVAMAFALEGARAVITLPATRTKQGKVSSNIIWSYGHITIPRHLRDIVVTEYGVADLRNKSDAEVIAAMLSITDSRFQEDLLEQAKVAGKINKDFQIPGNQRQNTPDRLQETLSPFKKCGQLKTFPLGSDFSSTEERLLPALKLLETIQGAKLKPMRMLLRKLWKRKIRQEDLDCLERMKLLHPQTWHERLNRALLLASLEMNEEHF